MFKPMLAVNTKVEDIKLPVYGSLKLEGVRGIFTPAGLFTRPLKRFGNPLLEERFKDLIALCKSNNMYIEGEFYKHGIEFGDISSICRRMNHPDTNKIDLHLFDCYDPHCPNADFQTRIRYLRSLPPSNVITVLHQDYILITEV